MEHQKILNLLNEASNYRFLTRKRNIVNDQFNPNYDAGIEIIHYAEVLKYDLCDYNDAYILVRVDIITTLNILTPVAFRIVHYLLNV